MTRFDVVGIGNAIVDVLTQTDEAFITKQNLSKGTMTLIDADQAKALYNLMPTHKAISGGSAANTLAGIASLGGKGAFIGKVADDSLGDAFRNDIRAVGTTFDSTPLIGGAPTARCLIFVTPDAQRTMNTYLGACVELSPNDVDENVIKDSLITYMEGYLWDPPKAKEAFLKAAEIAHQAGRKVSLSLSDPFCVSRHRDSFLELINGHVDILFANEAEATALFETDSIEKAAQELSKQCELSAITLGDKGSLVVTANEKVSIPAEPLSKLKDTTGAGDLYASGFLYGYSRGFSPADCGKLGGIAAAEVISHVGARPIVSLTTLIPSNLRVS